MRLLIFQGEVAERGLDLLAGVVLAQQLLRAVPAQI